MVSFSGVSTFQFSSLMKRHYSTDQKTVRLDSSEIAFCSTQVVQQEHLRLRSLRTETWWLIVFKLKHGFSQF